MIHKGNIDFFVHRRYLYGRYGNLCAHFPSVGQSLHLPQRGDLTGLSFQSRLVVKLFAHGTSQAMTLLTFLIPNSYKHVCFYVVKPYLLPCKTIPFRLQNLWFRKAKAYVAFCKTSLSKSFATLSVGGQTTMGASHPKRLADKLETYGQANEPTSFSRPQYFLNLPQGNIFHFDALKKLGYVCPYCVRAEACPCSIDTNGIRTYRKSSL